MRTDPTGMLTAPDAGGVAGLNNGFRISLDGIKGDPGLPPTFRDLTEAAGFRRPGASRGAPPGWMPEWYVPIWLFAALQRKGSSAFSAMGQVGALTKDYADQLTGWLTDVGFEQGVPPRSGGVAVSHDAAGGVPGLLHGGADLTALMGFFPGGPFGDGEYRYGEAVGGGAYGNLLGHSAGVGGGQSDSSAVGASVTFVGAGPFFTNASSTSQLTGSFYNFNLYLGLVTGQLAVGGGVYVAAITAGIGPFPGLGFASFTTFTPEGAVSGR